MCSALRLSRFDLLWTRTWPDQHFDFSARDGDLLVGRIYRMMGGPADRKGQWHLIAHIGDRPGTASVEDKRDEAASALDEGLSEFQAEHREHATHLI